MRAKTTVLNLDEVYVRPNTEVSFCIYPSVFINLRSLLNCYEVQPILGNYQGLAMLLANVAIALTCS
ncbi:MAG: hypothetical protein HWQ35_15955 [Nostoc sp. NMS1]|uniref:hypothetical protein n=1 Tax=unclassified Nostoc TaxID=2593658 RepID=UPI0025FCD540|nr:MULTISPECIES: hypothetical protein [unclassified Nostoc]MBN3907989.1 hypothetical protein [Nostoc sp. NMS1]MBN3993786.1 hypothetical protein [Nostoc sp. NMS2]